MRTSTRARFLYLVKREREGSGSAHAREEWKRGKWAPARSERQIFENSTDVFVMPYSEHR